MLCYIKAVDGNEVGYVAFKGHHKSIPYIEMDIRNASLFEYRKAANFLKNSGALRGKGVLKCNLSLEPVSFESPTLKFSDVSAVMTLNSVKGLVSEISRLGNDLEDLYLYLKNEKDMTDEQRQIMSVIYKTLNTSMGAISYKKIFEE